MEISLKEKGWVFVDLLRKYDKEQLLEDLREYFSPDDYAKEAYHYTVERNEQYMQQLEEKDVFTLEALYRLNQRLLRVETKEGNWVFIQASQDIDEEEPSYSYYVGSVYDETSEVNAGSIVEYVPNQYVQINLPYFTRAKVISSLNGKTENLRYNDIIVELENGERTTLCMEEFMLVQP